MENKKTDTASALKDIIGRDLITDDFIAVFEINDSADLGLRNLRFCVHYIPDFAETEVITEFGFNRRKGLVL